MRCIRCHKPLKRPSPSGMGPTCAKKKAFGEGSVNLLDDQGQVIDRLGKAEAMAKGLELAFDQMNEAEFNTAFIEACESKDPARIEAVRAANRRRPPEPELVTFASELPEPQDEDEEDDTPDPCEGKPWIREAEIREAFDCRDQTAGF